MDIDWTKLLSEYGPDVGGPILMVIVFAGLIVYLAKSSAAANKETSKMYSGALSKNADAVDKVGDGLRVMNARQAAHTEVLRAQPAMYALQKLKIMDGGYSKEEKADLIRQVDAAHKTLDEIPSWKDGKPPADSPDSG